MQPLPQRPAGRLCRAVLVVATLVALALPTSAAVASSDHPKYLAPPGNPAVSQYLEVVPNAMGSAPPGSGPNPPPAHSGSGGGGQPNSLSPAEQKKLEHLGPDGKALANVVETTAPPAAATGGGSAGGTRSGSADGKSSSGGTNQSGAPDSRSPTQDSLSSTGSQSALPAVLSAAAGQGGGDGLGILLPALMGVGLLSVVFAVLRRRGARRP